MALAWRTQAGGTAGTQETAAATTPSIANLLQPIRDEYKLPCLGAAVIVEGELKEVGVVGVRKAGADVRAEAGDLFHLGSCTKAMSGAGQAPHHFLDFRDSLLNARNLTAHSTA